MARAWHHLPVSALAVLWNLVLVGDYLGLRFRVPVYVQQFTAEQLAWYAGMPLWMAAAWAVAVWSGMLAALFLTARLGAGVLFALSCAGWIALAAGLIWLREPPAQVAIGAQVLWLLGLAAGAAFVLFLYARQMRARLRH